MIIYAQIGESLVMYEGMSEQTITNMLTEQNLSFIFIDENTYKQKVAAYQAAQAAAEMARNQGA
jgi:hypothetical protein